MELWNIALRDDGLEFLNLSLLNLFDFYHFIEYDIYGVCCISLLTTYQTQTGLPPFYNQNLNAMYEKILSSAIPMPKYLSKDARSLFLGLLERDPGRRLGSSKEDASEIKEHAFFKGLDFEKLLRKEVVPPYKPKVVEKTDCTNIEAEFTAEVPSDTPMVATGSMLAAKDAFVGFTYDPNSTSALK